MPKEHENFRPYLEDILQFTQGRRVLTAREAMEYTGKSRHWLINRGLNCHIGVIQLARVMSTLNKEGL